MCVDVWSKQDSCVKCRTQLVDLWVVHQWLAQCSHRSHVLRCVGIHFGLWYRQIICRFNIHTHTYIYIYTHVQMPNAPAWVTDVIVSCSMLRLRVVKETLMKGPGSWKNCNEQVISPRQLLTHVLSGLLFFENDPTCQHFLEDALDLWGCQARVWHWSEWYAGSITQWTCSWMLFVACFQGQGFF